MNWSPYQENVFQFIRDNEARYRSGGERQSLQIGAVAGSGKSTCCLEVIRVAIEEGASCVYSMFTRPTVDEFKQKVIDAGLAGQVVVDTAHALGFAAIRKVRRRVKVDGKKMTHICDAFFNTLPENSRKRKYAGAVQKLVGFGKDRGIGIFCDVNDTSAWKDIIEHHAMTFEGGSDFEVDDEEKDVELRVLDFVIEKAIDFLKESNANTEVIDFSDMIYQALLFKCPLEQFDYVIVDEAQDTNPVRRELFLRMVRRGGCSIMVGDEHQAIMGFTGADNDAMEIFRNAVMAKILPLSICYRCDKAIVAHAQKWVSHIEASPTAKEGEVSKMKYDEFIKDPVGLGLSRLDAILCRKNAPLTQTAFTLIRKGIGCRIEGRDIGYSLLAMINRWKLNDLPTLRRRLETYRENEVAKAKAKKQDAKIENIQDKCDTLMCLIERAEQVSPTIQGLKNLIFDMFSNADDPKTRKDLLVLSTVHKAKGKEWNRVFLLGREDYMPSPWAKQDWEKDQEKNLIYVAVTRAKRKLVEVTNMPDDKNRKHRQEEIEEAQEDKEVNVEDLFGEEDDSQN